LVGCPFFLGAQSYVIVCAGILGWRGYFWLWEHVLTEWYIALPALLAHSALISWAAAIMSIIGGLLIYGTIITFGMFFQEEHEF
jgi:hypothetical protein